MPISSLDSWPAHPQRQEKRKTKKQELGLAISDVPEITEYKASSSQPFGPQTEWEFYKDHDSSRVNLPKPNDTPYGPITHQYSKTSPPPSKNLSYSSTAFSYV